MPIADTIAYTSCNSKELKIKYKKLIIAQRPKQIVLILNALIIFLSATIPNIILAGILIMPIILKNHL